MRKATEPNKSAVVIYHYVAHYRKRLFQHLSSIGEPLFTLVSGKKTDIPIQCLDPAYAEKELEKGGIRWSFIRNVWISGLLWQFGIFRTVMSKRFDTIIFLGNIYNISTWPACIFARLLGKRTIFWGHGYVSRERGLKRLARNCFYSLPHAHIVYHPRSKGLLVENGFSADNIYIVFNSLDYDDQLSMRKGINQGAINVMRKKLFPHSDAPILMFIGRLTNQKKLDLLLRAGAALNENGCEVNLLFVGDGQDRKNLEQLTATLGMDEHVCFFGACYDESEIADLVASSDVCISPGEVGLTAIHSFSFGTPVITHSNFDRQMPEYSVIKSGVTGAFFQEGDVEDLVRVIREWIESGRDRQAIREECFREIDKYWNPYYQERVFRAAIEGSQPIYDGDYSC